jgi:hypothetical protein
MKLKIYDWSGDDNYTFKDTWHCDCLIKPGSFNINNEDLNYIVINVR